MDLISLHYFQELSKDLNMTRPPNDSTYPSRPSATTFSAWSSTTMHLFFIGSPPYRSPVPGSSCWALPR